VEEEKEIDQTIEQAFQKARGRLPKDTYFKKIWHSIEWKAPVGEKYYLRSFLSIVLIFVLLTVFFFFYTEFLTSVLTLKDIRKENLRRRNTTSLLISRPAELKAGQEAEVSKGIRLSAMESSTFLVKKENGQPVLDFYNGHAVVNKISEGDILIVRLPDITVKISRGRCNIFCYDNMIRIIPLFHPVEIEHSGKKQTLEPSRTFYLLDKKELKIQDK
jgi:hypothetical protein